MPLRGMRGWRRWKKGESSCVSVVARAVADTTLLDSFNGGDKEASKTLSSGWGHPFQVQWIKVYVAFFSSCLLRTS